MANGSKDEEPATSKVELDIARGESVELYVNPSEQEGREPEPEPELTPEERSAERNRAVLEAMFKFMETEGGLGIATRLVGLAERIQSGTSKNASVRIWFEKWTQLAIIIGVITAASILAWNGKFDSTIGVLFGTLVGYVFGRGKG